MELNIHYLFGSNIVFQTQTCLRTKFWLEDVIWGNKTVRHPLKKTVQHQDSSGTVEKVVKSAPHFLSNKRDYLFQNKINENLKKASMIV